ncbi:hypothetical protein COL154_010333 [Colletotrichum chrysophilum]|uniref:uncharacterized protein n=1 Tax=Colletotrichum chrysophilum TaxID=1836956 RepID=UPI0023001BEA|nr:uncharacterized protein COL26b_010477 [Colletotrichum chrysophilum]KAJ0344257.1 hypothetical protein KNSL1_009513 [Colletotrichum chrysophilum]KAJ0357209.1 hypothetical protein COL154_010333 [Colletotrichum chrysophilum]KAJ0369398.1 hypothetical protein COL26b_010477 [Colletotrichum chrysophilum]
MSTVEDQRRGMAQAEAAGLELLGPCPPHLGEAWIDIPLPDGQVNRTKIVWPKPIEGQSLPLQTSLVVYFHGGGFAVGSPDIVLAPTRGFASMFPTVVVCPSLNQLPEQPFPAPVQIAWEVCAWLSDAKHLNGGILEAEDVKVDLHRGFVIGGVSAGGGAAASIGGISAAIAAGSNGFDGLSPLRSPITGIFSGTPMLATETMLPPRFKEMFKSREENGDGTGQTSAMVRELEQLLGTAVNTPWFSPIHLDSSNPAFAKNHPPKVFTYYTTLDPFRDDCLIYNKWLSELPGVESRTSAVENESHTAWVSLPPPECHSRRIKEATLDGISWLLGLDWNRRRSDLPT